MSRRVTLLIAVLLSCLAATVLVEAFAHHASAAGHSDPLVPNQGNLVWTPFDLSEDSLHTQQAAHDHHHNRYQVVWADGAGNDFNIYGQLLAANNTPVGAPVTFVDSTLNQYHSAVGLYDGDQGGAFLATSDEQHASLQSTDINGRWVTGNGGLLGGALPVVTGNGTQERPALAVNGLTGQFPVAWQGIVTTPNRIFAMHTTAVPYDLSVNADHFWSLPFVIHNGDSVTLTAQVFNLFGQALAAVPVAFYNGDPDAGGQQIGTTTVDFATGDHTAQASVAWDIAGLSGVQELFVVVDTQNTIPEVNETNNATSRSRTIWPLSSDTQAPTGTLTINAGAFVADSSQVTLTIEAYDDNPLGATWMYLRQWWVTSATGLVETITVGGQRGEWQNRDSGWMRYRPEYATTGLPFSLNGNPGIHYVQVWLRDAAGNISQPPPPIWDSINYLPPFAWTLMPDEWHLYRMSWTPGTSVAVSMTVTGDDDALVVWSPGHIGIPDLVSDLPGPNAHTESLAFIAASGVYQILAYGQAPYGGQYQIGWQPANGGVTAVSVAQPADAVPSVPVIPPDETPPTRSGLPEFQVAATGVFATPWTDIAPGETLTFTHNLGGDPDQYAVELWFQDTDSGGAGIHRRAYGGDLVDGQLTGAYWWDVTGSIIRVTRGAGDSQADQVRLRIWQTDPPDWDSGWLAIVPGDANQQSLTHNLGGNADDYLVSLKFRDSRGLLGVHHYGYGGLDLGGQVQGAAWLNLTNASVGVVRFAGDLAVGEFRLQIYRPDPADPPNYDSGWQGLTQGQMTTLSHAMGGNPASYVVRVATRSGLHGINSFGAGGLTLNSGQQRGAALERLTGANVGLFRLAQDIYAQQARLRIWLPTRIIYLPLVANSSAALGKE